jgi:ribonuclease HI
MKMTVYIDGGSRGNPGHSACAAILQTPEGSINIKKYLGHRTNNEAEYQGLILALEWATSFPDCELVVYTDSELLAKQMRGEYAVKSPILKPLFERAISLLPPLLDFQIIHIPRENNKKADAAVNEVLDEFESRKPRQSMRKRT